MVKVLDVNTFLHTVEVLGIVAFASSGLVEARLKKMDLVGVFTVAFITAFGGGTLRDLLLDRRPLFWVEHQEYIILIFVLALLTAPLLRHLRSSITERFIDYADALGLGLFSVSGTTLALQEDMPMFVCVMMGVITGIFGGVLRDVICNEIPMVFRRGQLYATCSFAGCWLYLLLDRLHMGQTISVLSGISLVFFFRILAIRFDWKLPA
jgi:uncharacterized membrane protein YeiH